VVYKGACLCGAIEFEITGAIRDIVYCHCSQCRKAQGSAFATNGNVDAKCFNLLTGADKLTGYESSPGQTKYFCKTCGSPIISKHINKPDKVRVRLGTIESAIEERPGSHIFVASKADWEDITDNLPKYDAYGPE